MHKVLTWLFWILVVLYVAALAAFAIGIFGLFGQEQDPLSGIFLIPLGFPWFLLAELLPEAAWPWVAALAPLANIGVVRWLVGRTRPATSVGEP